MRAAAATLALFLTAAGGAVQANGILPVDVNYDRAIPTPSGHLGFDVGTWHVRHDRLVSYMRLLAERSDRVALIETGTTHEGRPLLLLAITSPANQRDLDSLLETHRRASDGSGKLPDGPLVVWQGYSVHGNESSGSNAALLVAYYLTAARGRWIDRLLDESLIFLDPALNPDGLSRFASWANRHKGRTPIADPEHREHVEDWPGGRTNHYWFDLNRDWLLLTQPESRARVAQFHRLRPHVLTDFHEMGRNSTYFFQPGVPGRKHPLTPQRNVELTARIATYHAQALDAVGQPYYSEETFDDFYYGKGSTYPDVNGAVGILFEQASSRGHVIDTDHGTLTFERTIRNQFLTSLSTLRGALDLKAELRRHQSEFYQSALEESSRQGLYGWVLGDGGDPARASALLGLLRAHDIEVHELGQEVSVDGRRFEPGSAWLLPGSQRQFRLLQAAMERRTEFEDDTFYDVSAWTLPLSFGLPQAELRGRRPEALRGRRVDVVTTPAGRFRADPVAVAYAFEWGSSYYSPRTLGRLQAAGVRTYAATAPMTVLTARGERALERGAIVVPLGSQTVDRERIESVLALAAETDSLEIHAVATGLTPRGPDLGSPSLRPLEPLRPLLVVGSGVNAYEAGEVWHLLDTRYEVALTMVEADRLAAMELTAYSHVILVDGGYGGLGDGVADKLRGFVRDGGVLVAAKRAARWVTRQGLHRRGGEEVDEPVAAEENEADEKSGEEIDPKARPLYVGYRESQSRKRIAGAIVQVELDLTHPLTCGYRATELPVFRNAAVFLDAGPSPYETVAVYSAAPLLSGFVGPERLEELSGSAALLASRVGSGLVVRIADDLNFRGAWYGTNRLFVNALFLSSLVDRTDGGDAVD